MAKNKQGPYDQYNDRELLLRYLKLEEDYDRFIVIPTWAGLDIPETQKVAEKIDKLVAECILRGLMVWDGWLTKKAIELKPWTDETLLGKCHNFWSYVDHITLEEKDAIRIKAEAEFNQQIQELKVLGRNDLFKH